MEHSSNDIIRDLDEIESLGGGLREHPEAPLQLVDISSTYLISDVYSI